MTEAIARRGKIYFSSLLFCCWRWNRITTLVWKVTNCCPNPTVLVEFNLNVPNETMVLASRGSTQNFDCDSSITGPDTSSTDLLLWVLSSCLIPTPAYEIFTYQVKQLNPLFQFMRGFHFPRCVCNWTCYNCDSYFAAAAILPDDLTRSWTFWILNFSYAAETFYFE